MANKEKPVGNDFHIAGDHLISAYDCYVNGDRKGAAMHSIMAMNSPDMAALVKFLRDRIEDAEESRAPKEERKGDKESKAVAAAVSALGYEDDDPNCDDAVIVRDEDFSDPDAESEDDGDLEADEPAVIDSKEFENPEGVKNIYVEASAKKEESEEAVEERVLTEEQKALAERHQALAAIHRAIALHHARGKHDEGALKASGDALAKSEHHIAAAKGIIGEERVREERKAFANAVHKQFGIPGKNFDVKAAESLTKRF